MHSCHESIYGSHIMIIRNFKREAGFRFRSRLTQFSKKSTVSQKETSPSSANFTVFKERAKQVSWNFLILTTFLEILRGTSLPLNTRWPVTLSLKQSLNRGFAWREPSRRIPASYIIFHPLNNSPGKPRWANIEGCRARFASSLAFVLFFLFFCYASSHQAPPPPSVCLSKRLSFSRRAARSASRLFPLFRLKNLAKPSETFLSCHPRRPHSAASCRVPRDKGAEILQHAQLCERIYTRARVCVCVCIYRCTFHAHTELSCLLALPTARVDALDEVDAPRIPRGAGGGGEIKRGNTGLDNEGGRGRGGRNTRFKTASSVLRVWRGSFSFLCNEHSW